MPDSSGLLSQEDKNKVIQHVKRTPRDLLPVPLDRGSWVVGDHLIENRAWTGGNLIVGGPTYASVMLVEMTSGFTVFINAVIAGIVATESPEESDVTDSARQ